MSKPQVNVQRLEFQHSVNIDVPEGEILSLIKSLQELHDKYSEEGWEKIYVEEQWCGYEDNYFILSLHRKETTSEYEKRIAKEEKDLEARCKQQEKAKEKREARELEKAKQKQERLLKELADLESGVLAGNYRGK